MEIENRHNQTVIKKAFSGVIIETQEGKQLHVCLRDTGFEIKLDNGKWRHIESEEDFSK